MLDLQLLIAQVLQFEQIIVVGSGPSVSYALDEVLQQKNTFFLLADSIAHSCITMQHKLVGEFHNRQVVFSVENRRHHYLSSIIKTPICFYRNANWANLPKNHQKVYLFGLKSDQASPVKSRENRSVFYRKKNEIDCIKLKSPGTVTGIMIAFILYIAKQHPIWAKRINVKLLGVDFAFIDNQMYPREIYSGLFRPHNRFNTILSEELIRVFEKSAYGWIRDGQMIKSSAELVQTRENIIELMQKNVNIHWAEYSPLGISQPFVEKLVPKIFM